MRGKEEPCLLLHSLRNEDLEDLLQRLLLVLPSLREVREAVLIGVPWRPYAPPDDAVRDRWGYLWGLRDRPLP